MPSVMRRNLLTALRGIVSAALITCATSVLAEPGDTPPKCAPTFRVLSIPDIQLYYPRPCWHTAFITVVEITVDKSGRAGNVAFANAQDLPPEESECIQDKIRHWLIGCRQVQDRS